MDSKTSIIRFPENSGRILIDKDNLNILGIHEKMGILGVNFPEVLSLFSVKVHNLIELNADLANGTLNCVQNFKRIRLNRT